ncbi:MAG: hypothetical protein CM15mP49_02960 [Actinomycetota bacterium]|nr:MAG: hypothetical protein CM15mP49_02960 [Actinomycetota bacterium]
MGKKSPNEKCNTLLRIGIPDVTWRQEPQWGNLARTSHPRGWWRYLIRQHCRAYNRLDPEIKNPGRFTIPLSLIFLRRLGAICPRRKIKNGKNPPARHPVIQKHPETGGRESTQISHSFRTRKGKSEKGKVKASLIAYNPNHS